MLVKERELTVNEFEAFLNLPENRDRLLELVNGEIVEKMPTEEHGYIAGNVITAINNFAKPRKLGRAGVEVRHQLPNDPFNSRMPDVSFHSARRPIVREGSVPEIAEFAVEIKSPDDSLKVMRNKADYYIRHGARLVWLILPHKRIVEVYEPEEDVQIYMDGDLLDGGGVLPGFSLPVHELFDDPFTE